MNKIDLEGRTAVVTGGARGIGLAIAGRLVDSGAAVALWDIDADAAKDAAGDLLGRGQVRDVAVDLTDADAVDAAAIKRVAERVLTGGAPTLTAIGPISRLESYDAVRARFS